MFITFIFTLYIMTNWCLNEIRKIKNGQNFSSDKSDEIFRWWRTFCPTKNFVQHCFVRKGNPSSDINKEIVHFTTIIRLVHLQCTKSLVCYSMMMMMMMMKNCFCGMVDRRNALRFIFSRDHFQIFSQSQIFSKYNSRAKKSPMHMINSVLSV